MMSLHLSEVQAFESGCSESLTRPGGLSPSPYEARRSPADRHSFRSWPRAGSPYPTDIRIEYSADRSLRPFPWPHRKSFTPEALYVVCSCRQERDNTKIFISSPARTEGYDSESRESEGPGTQTHRDSVDGSRGRQASG